MTDSAILSYPIEPIAALPIDATLTKALLNSLNEYSQQLHGRRIWLACSGGRDSLALAALCSQLYYQGKLPFLPQLLHVNHNLQAGSSAWAQHVADWAKAQNLSCRILSVHINGHDEQAARQARYEVMCDQLNQDDVLLLAHHSDDQAETVLMRLIQGAGVKGLAGMQPWRIQTQGAHRIVLLRPWLTIKRHDISTYAQRLKLPYIDDPTNEAGDNVRSGLRRDIMPILTTYNPNVIDNIARSAQLLNDAQAIVIAQAQEDLQQIAVTSLQLPPAQRVLNIDKLRALPIYRQRQLLHHWLAQDEPLPPAKKLVDEVLNLSQRDDNNHQTALFWQGRKASYSIRRYRQQLYRLSSDWLKWLELPLTEQLQTSFNGALTDRQSADNKQALNKPISVILRSNDKFIWQLQIQPNDVAKLLANAKGNNKVELSFAPLSRHETIQTELASRPQSGKKLYQTLAIPSWMRESLVVVSIAVLNADEVLNSEYTVSYPILLLSPFKSWRLTAKPLNLNTDIKRFSELIKSDLTVQKTY